MGFSVFFGVIASIAAVMLLFIISSIIRELRMRPVELSAAQHCCLEQAARLQAKKAPDCEVQAWLWASLKRRTAKKWATYVLKFG